MIKSTLSISLFSTAFIKMHVLDDILGLTTGLNVKLFLGPWLLTILSGKDFNSIISSNLQLTSSDFKLISFFEISPFDL